MTIPETTAEARKRLSRLSVQACRRWAPPPKLTLSGWADTYRRLSPEASSEPGQWYTDRIPYLREPMDCVTDPACEWVVLKFASQSAKTEILLNATGYYMHQDPSPMLFVEPRLEDCKALSKDRVAPMVRDTPALRGLVRDPRSRDSGNTTLHKALSLDTPLPTPHGWTTMGEVRVGDTVFDENGKPCRVTYVTPVMHGRPCYRVAFSDGCSVVADDEHPWRVDRWRVVKSAGEKPRQERRTEIVTTADLRDATPASGRRPYSIPMTRPLALPEADLLIDPYVLGAWLGDGYSHAARIVAGHQDAEMAELVGAVGSRDLGHVLELRLDGPCLRGALGRFAPVPDSIRSSLNALGLLRQAGHGPSRKAIPAAYLRASFEQRLALLQGLMDTDGSIRDDGWCVFVTVLPALRDGASELMTSLGIKHAVKSVPATGAWRLEFAAPRSMPVFRLTRKLQRQWARSERSPNEKAAERRRVVAVESVESVPVRCISVDSPSHLYLAGSGMVPTHNTFPGGHLTLAGANSPAGLAMRPIRVVMCDEVSRYEASAGTEGDPVSLAVTRTTTFWNRKIILASSPGLEGECRISKAFNDTDQRHYYVPCPDCGHMQTLEWSHVEWQKDASEHKPDTARYRCDACGTLWSDGARWKALRDGEWRAHKPFRGRAGFTISQLYSPWKRLGELATEYLLAHGKPEEEKTFVNTKLGLEYKEPGEAPDWQRLYDRREPWKLGTVPRDGLLLTAGGDLQKDRLEVYVWAWGRGMRRWLVDHIVIQGGPERAETWAKLREIFAERWPHESGQDMRIEKLALDTGYDASAVYSFARAFGDYQLLVPIKGESHSYSADQPVRGPTYQDVAQGGKKIRRGVKLWQVSSAFFKNELYRQFRLDRPTDEEAEATGWPPGYVHLPGDLGSDQVRQLVAERRILRNGKYIWEKVGGQERNEALDCAVYARAAAWLMQIDRWTPARWRDREASLGLLEATAPPKPVSVKPSAELPSQEPETPSPPPHVRSAVARNRSGGWLGGHKGNWLRR